ncbi:MAG: hypothetical protein K0Q85_1031, partial [Caproiciproducens sp.]|nr:hypothetical protein [Caproiciproducens sp.]
VYENQNVNVSFRTDNWNLNKAYSNIPMDVLLDGTVIKTEYVNFAAYGVGFHHYNIDIGENVGNHTISARINWGKRNNEVDPNNNCTSNISITIKAAINLQIEAVTPNSDYRQGVEVMTTFRIKNLSRHDIVPSHNLTVSLFIRYSGRTITVPVKISVVIPAYGENLVYWKWAVPQNAAGKVFSLTATVNSNGGVDETNTADNSAVLIRTITAATNSQTPDTQYESKSPSGFTIINPPAATCTSAVWSEWVYENERFVKKNYGLKIDTATSEPQLIPDNNSPSRKYENGYWQIRAGYGFSFSYSVGVSSISGKFLPNTVTYTAWQSGYATFPEFKYSTAQNKYRTLERIGNVFIFYSNLYATRNARLHFLPLWYPDGDYVVSTTIYDLWTPAGMISATITSKPLIIIGSAFDDYYVGK